MTDFVKICPRCGTPNPEYENLCSECGQFVGMEPSVPRPAEAPTPPPAPPEEPPSPPPRPTPAATSVEVGSCWLEPLFGGEILTVRSGAVLGQAHESNDAELQIPATVDGSAYLHRRHCRLDREGDGWYLTAIDQAAFGRDFTNPTRVNEETLAPGERRQVGDGDELRLSDLRFRVKIL